MGRRSVAAAAMADEAVTPAAAARVAASALDVGGAGSSKRCPGAEEVREVREVEVEMAAAEEDFTGDFFFFFMAMAVTVSPSLSLNTLGFLLVGTGAGAVKAGVVEAAAVEVVFTAGFLSNIPPCCCKGSMGSAESTADWPVGFFTGFSLVEGGRGAGVAGKVVVAGFMAPTRRFASLTSWSNYIYYINIMSMIMITIMRKKGNYDFIMWIFFY